MHRRSHVIRRFLEGLAFGGGLALAFLVVLATGLMVVPVTFNSTPRPVEDAIPPPQLAETPRRAEPDFHDLPVEERIKQSSAIALARYEPGPDGKKRAIIKEFLKRDPGLELYYNIGDEFTMGGYRPKEGEVHGDGQVIFFVGSPARAKLSMSYSGDRIAGLADIPIELFRQKCKADA